MPHRQDPTDLIAHRRPLRHSRSVWSRGAGLAAMLGLCLAASGAQAQASAPIAKATVKAAQAKLGLPADGVSGTRTRRALRAYERAHGLPVDGRLDSAVLTAMGLAPGTDATAAAAPSTGGATSDDGPGPASSSPASPALAAIAECESGGDPTAVSPNGRYRGKYQFSRSTWRSLGGKGDPAAAPEAEQDRRAARLMARQGPSAWPVCSR